MCRVKNGSNVKRSVCFFCVGTTFSYKETRVPESSDNLNRKLTGSETLSLDVGGGEMYTIFGSIRSREQYKIYFDKET